MAVYSVVHGKAQPCASGEKSGPFWHTIAHASIRFYPENNSS